MMLFSTISVLWKQHYSGLIGWSGKIKSTYVAVLFTRVKRGQCTKWKITMIFKPYPLSSYVGNTNSATTFQMHGPKDSGHGHFLSLQHIQCRRECYHYWAAFAFLTNVSLFEFPIPPTYKKQRFL